MAETEPHKGALHARHVAMEAKMGQEGGWEVPLAFSSVAEEVAAVRRRAGVMDVSHIGRIRIRGAEAVDLLERVCTADAARQEDDTAIYTLLCNERGGVIDHGLLLRLEGFWVLTCSPGGREKVIAHLQQAGDGLDVKIDDQTLKTSQIAVSGPAAAEILNAVLPMKVSHLPRLAVKTGSLMIARYIAARTGFTGAWSLEVILTNMMAGQAWRFITEKAGANRLPPIGIDARDVLRIEAGLPRYGHELNETIDPITAGLERAVDFEHDFVGRDALLAIRQKLPARKLVGLILDAPAGEGEAGSIPRQGSPVQKEDGNEVGTVTSGTYSPTLDKIIAMAYVARDAAEAGAELLVEVQGRALSARLAGLPFMRKT